MSTWFADMGSAASTGAARQSPAKYGTNPPGSKRAACCGRYVGNLSPGVTDAVLKQLMEPFGNVLHAVVLLDMSTGQSRGFGFIHMDCSKAAGDVRPRAARCLRVLARGREALSLVLRGGCDCCVVKPAATLIVLECKSV